MRLSGLHRVGVGSRGSGYGFGSDPKFGFDGREPLTPTNIPRPVNPSIPGFLGTCLQGKRL